MNITKDDNLALTTKIYGFVGKFYLSATVMLGFSLKKQRYILTENELWNAAAESLGENQLLDSGMPKAKGEVLLAGFCHADGGRPVEATQAGFRVGQIEKKIAVFGDRYWLDEKSGQHTAPVPFTRMPLGWENAFGGPSNQNNPLGKGISAVKLPDGRTVYPLPNLEYPDRLIAFRNDTPPPASPAPQGLDWPGRMQKSGTFDEKWLATVWPGLPADFDFSLFNLSPNDQRLGGYFKGGEELQLNRLMPDAPHLSSRLPEKRVRLFIMRSSDPAAGWIEAKSNCDTLWLLPEADAGVLIWHATWEIADEEAEDVARLMAVFEEPASHTAEAQEHAARFSEAEEPATPAASPPAPPQPATTAAVPPSPAPSGAISTEAAVAPSIAAAAITVSAIDESMKEQEQKLLEQLISLGIDQDAQSRLPDPPPEIDAIKVNPDLPPDEQMAQLEEKLKEHLQKMGIDPDAAPPAADTLKVPTVAETVAAIKAMPGDNSEMIKGLEEMEAERNRIQAENAKLQAEMKPQQQERNSGSPSCEQQPDEPSQPQPGSDDDIRQRLENGQGLAGMNLSNRDLRGYKLTGVDLSSANMQGSDLSGMDLSSTIMHSAKLTDARLGGVNLSRASLTNALMEKADLTGANLTSADLTNARLSGAKLSHADISDADLSGASLSSADLTGAKGTRASFEGADISQANLGGAILTSANLCEAKATGANFSQADLRHTHLSGIDATEANFEAARMTSASADTGSNFNSARMSGVEMEQAYFEQADFTTATLSGNRMRGAIFLHCNMQRADLHGASAHGAEFKRSDLKGANLSQINLMDGTLFKTELHGADLSGANLFGADIRDCNIREAKTTGANLKRTIVAARGGMQ